ncbi:poly [ADP-ribose] polymerase 3-like 3 [Homarus americanus]|uniref:Poly [ADP-ribose] polymerase 3-like 3 n=1 Tax=Homarus americanus TaxID=6706 RepID=A0A8J5JPY2_HOMAM|nr:poly [ADP-ribose] polymerase 3-like 3 [Homarus americanus]
MIKLIFSDEMFVDQMSTMKLASSAVRIVIQVLHPRPSCLGRSVPPVMYKDSMVQSKKEDMFTLSDIELTQSLQKDMANKGIHPLMEKYEMLDCVLELVNKKEPEFKIIQEYISCPDSRQGPLTEVAVVAAILKAGLRIMPHSGGLVGRGIYFASEHARGCWSGEDMVGFMFLVEVALGRESSITQCDGSLTKAPGECDSIVARGRNEPDPKKDKKLTIENKEVIVPVGKPVPQKKWATSGFHQSEYLVYKESQAASDTCSSSPSSNYMCTHCTSALYILRSHTNLSTLQWS